MKNFSIGYKYVTSLSFIEEYIILIDIFKYIYLYRALLKYANFAKSCRAEGKSWGQVEKARRKDEFWSPAESCKHLKICSQVSWQMSHVFSFTSLYDHKIWSHLCIITCISVMIAIILIQDMIISCQYQRRSQVWAVISYESWDPHGLMITHWDADTYITFKSVSPSRLSKPE